MTPFNVLDVPRDTRNATAVRDPIAELLRGHVADGCEYVMTIQAYFDESERVGAGPEPICLAGYLFRPVGYLQFTRKWSRLLRRFRLEHFHMTDLYAGQEDAYKRLGDRRGVLFGEAVDLIRQHALAGFAALFDQAEFEAVAPPWFVKTNGSVYTTACQLCMRMASSWLDKRGASQSVAYHFENGHKFRSEADAIMGRIPERKSLGDLFRYQSHTFVGKPALGLQAADLLAWTVTRLRVGFPDNATRRLLRPHLERLAGGDNHLIQHFTGERLRQFFLDQAERPQDYMLKKPTEFRGKLR